MNSPASLQFLGTAGTVTGSRYLLETDGRAPRMTDLTLGEPDSADTLRGRINRELNWQARVPEHLEGIDLEEPV